jgi:hypothetical protein
MRIDDVKKVRSALEAGESPLSEADRDNIMECERELVFPLPGINCPPYFPTSPHPLPPLRPYYSTMPSTISVFLIWNS